MRRRELTEPWIHSENDTHQLFWFYFTFVEWSAGVDLGIHSTGQTLDVNQGLLAKVCPAACVQQNPLMLPVWQTCPQVDKVRSEAKSAAQVGLGKPNKGQWVCADPEDAWNRDGPSKSSFWLLPEEVQKAMKLGQDGQGWSFSVKLQMIWSLSQEKASCSKPCPDHAFVSSLAFLSQLCKTEEVQRTPEQEGQTLSDYPSNCTAKGVHAPHEARPSAQG